jgi:hypothetical protein
MRLARLWRLLSFPPTAVYLFAGANVHPAYGLGWAARLRLAWRMARTTRRVFTATSYKAHLAMAVKLLEIGPEVEGVVVECGSFLGGSTANLSLVCDIVGRDLIVYDSFEGLPEPTGNDRFANPRQTGKLAGGLERVKANVAANGAVERCEFRKGWFDDTLPQHSEPIVLAFLDVDYQASLDTCVRHLWPHLTERGYVFIDEYVLTDYCALFWSESWWRDAFDTTPPGLIGAGSGIGVGQYYVGPARDWSPPQEPASVAYTRKDLSGYWGYSRDAAAREDQDPDATLVETIIDIVEDRTKTD